MGLPEVWADVKHNSLGGTGKSCALDKKYGQQNIWHCSCHIDNLRKKHSHKVMVNIGLDYEESPRSLLNTYGNIAA